MTFCLRLREIMRKFTVPVFLPAKFTGTCNAEFVLCTDASDYAVGGVLKATGRSHAMAA